MTMQVTKPEAIDKAAKEYMDLKKAFNEAKKKLDDKDDELIALVDKSGTTPQNSEKSLRLEGYEFQLTVTRGNTTSIDRVHVLKLISTLKKKGCYPLLKNLFRAEVKFTVAKSAKKFLSKPLPAKAPRNLSALFDACLDIDTKSPSLKVEPRKSEVA